MPAGGAERENTRVSADSLINDFRRNMAELEKFGVDISNVDYYLPPSEWYNRETVRLIETQGASICQFYFGTSNGSRLYNARHEELYVVAATYRPVICFRRRKRTEWGGDYTYPSGNALQTYR